MKAILDPHRESNSVKSISVKSIQDKSVQELNSSLCKLLAEINNILFDHSKKVTVNNIKSSFTEAMNKIRNEHDNIQSRFMDQLEEKFRELQAPPLDQKETIVPKKFQIDSMTLIKDDELEENIAIDAIIAKSKANNKVVLSQLVDRLDKAIENKKIDSDNNPLRPRVICEAFQFSIQHLEIEIAPKLIIYKLFDRKVMTPLVQLYGDINQSLKSKGILADLPDQPAIKQTQQKQENSKAESEEEELDKGTNVLAALKEILTDYNGKKSYSPVNFANIEAAQGFEGTPQPVIEQTALIQALSTAQSTQQQQFETNTENVPVIDIKNQIGSILSTPQPLSGQTIGQVNDNIIDFISMLFDFILEDYNLPDEFKALIARLQIPVLKVALIDETFLSKGNHPARVLINEMGRAGIGWTSDLGTGLKDIITEIVNRIIHEFDKDLSIFTEELEKFNQFNDTHKKRVKLVEKRVRETEEGKAKRHTAEKAATSAMQDIAGDLHLPQVIEKLLFEDWKNLMQMVFLRKGIDSKKWQKHLKTASDLVASLFPVMTNQLKENLENSLPDLIDDLKAGLEFSGSDEFENTEFFIELEALHSKVLEGKSVFLEPPQEDVHEEDVLLIEEMALDQAQPEKSDDNNYSSSSEEENEDIKEEIEHDVELNAIQIDEDNALDDMHYFDQVESLEVGTWFKVIEHSKGEEKSIHCKLVAIIESVDKYIFVNHSGRKVAEFTKEQLVESFRKNQVIQLEKGALFERALKSIVLDYRTKQYQEDSM